MSLLLLAEWGISEIETAQLQITSLSHICLLFPCETVENVSLPPFIVIPLWEDFSPDFSSLKAFCRRVVVLNVCFLYCSILFGLWNLCTADSGLLSTVCPSAYHAYFLLEQKIPSKSCDHSCMNTAFLPILPKAIMNTLLSKPGKFCAVILIGKIKSKVIFCIWRVAMVE